MFVIMFMLLFMLMLWCGDGCEQMTHPLTYGGAHVVAVILQCCLCVVVVTSLWLSRAVCLCRLSYVCGACTGAGVCNT